MKGWQRVYKSPLQHRAEMVKDILRDNDLQAVVVNKTDSNYRLGYYEVHVVSDNVLRAIKIIQDDISFE